MGYPVAAVYNQQQIRNGEKSNKRSMTTKDW